jgi:mono/diheme cytochrome c family protein
MKTWKWLFRGIAVIAGLTLLAFAYLYIASERLLHRHYPLPPSSVRAGQGAAAIAHGDRLAHAFGCTDCHRPNLEGAFIPDFGVWSLNLTQLAKSFSDRDFDRAIRHGLRPDGTSVAEFMPSDAFQYMSDADLADILAFIRSHPLHGAAHAVPSYGIKLRIGLLTGLAKSRAELRARPAARHDRLRRMPHDRAAGRNAASTASSARSLDRRCLQSCGFSKVHAHGQGGGKPGLAHDVRRRACPHQSLERRGYERALQLSRRAREKTHRFLNFSFPARSVGR